MNHVDHGEVFLFIHGHRQRKLLAEFEGAQVAFGFPNGRDFAGNHHLDRILIVEARFQRLRLGQKFLVARVVRNLVQIFPVDSLQDDLLRDRPVKHYRRAFAPFPRSFQNAQRCAPWKQMTHVGMAPLCAHQRPIVDDHRQRRIDLPRNRNRKVVSSPRHQRHFDSAPRSFRNRRLVAFGDSPVAAQQRPINIQRNQPDSHAPSLAEKSDRLGHSAGSRLFDWACTEELLASRLAQLRYNLFMSEPAPSHASATALGPIQAFGAYSNHLRWFELSLVLILAFATPFLRSLALLRNGPGAQPTFDNLRWLYGLGHEIIGLALLGYVLLRRGLKLSDLGLRWSFRALGAGLLLTVAYFIALLIGGAAVYGIHLALFGTIAKNHTMREFFGHPSWLVIPFAMVNPFFEELIVRAFLMTEVLELTGSAILAVVGSTALQFSYHLYYGWTGALTISTGFLVFSLYYLRTRHATPLVVSHGIIDILGMLQLWLH